MQQFFSYKRDIHLIADSYSQNNIGIRLLFALNHEHVLKIDCTKGRSGIRLKRLTVTHISINKC